jgi:hypothetical protein
MSWVNSPMVITHKENNHMVINFSDLSLPAQVTSILVDLNDEVVNREEALKLLANILQYRTLRGYESSELIEVMKRVWDM